MSTPQHPHRLRREQEKGAGGEYVAARYSQMHCDSETFLRCPLPPIRAPRIVVVPKPFDFTIAPIYKFTTLHFCERHRHECTLDKILDSPSPWGGWSVRAEIERIAKQKWPHGHVPDFECESLAQGWPIGTGIQWMLTTTPEYRGFLELLETSAADQGVMSDPYNGVAVL